MACLDPPCPQLKLGAINRPPVVPDADSSVLQGLNHPDSEPEQESLRL